MGVLFYGGSAFLQKGTPPKPPLKVSLCVDFLGEKLLQKFLPLPLFKNFKRIGYGWDFCLASYGELNLDFYHTW